VSDVTIDAMVPDWSRERPRRFWDPSRKLLKAIRDYQCASSKLPLLRQWARYSAVLRHRFWSVVCGCDIPLNCSLGGGLKLTHPNGVVIHPEAEVGVNCLLLQQVTLVKGVRLAGHVDIGAGAKLVRPVRVGAHAQIGANAVVLEDVPAGATVIGVPARNVKVAVEAGSDGWLTPVVEDR